MGWGVSPTPRPPLPPGKTRYPFYRRLGGPQGRSGRAENVVPIGIRSRTVQPVVSRYTDWATRPTFHNISNIKRIFLDILCCGDLFTEIGVAKWNPGLAWVYCKDVMNYKGRNLSNKCLLFIYQWNIQILRSACTLAVCDSISQPTSILNYIPDFHFH